MTRLATATLALVAVSLLAVMATTWHLPATWVVAGVAVAVAFSLGVVLGRRLEPARRPSPLVIFGSVGRPVVVTRTVVADRAG